MVVQDIRAADAEDLRWLRIGWLKRVRERTSTYSVVTGGIALLFAALVAFELFEDDLTLFERLLSGGILAACLALFAMVFAGVELARWTGMVLVIAHAAVSAYYLGLSDERQNAIAALQELPLMAMYFSWFYGARVARLGELVILLTVGTATALGPFASPGDDGSNPLFGPVNVIGAGLFTWLCLEAGIFVRHRIRLEAHTDELTGALNRRGFVATAGEELRRAVRHDRPLSIAVLDLDEFKSVNDEAGHKAGDFVLKSLSAQWMSLSRTTDVVGRLGGDEFVMLLPETTEAQARELMHRLRAYASHPWSWGVAELRRGDDLDALLHRADQAMYDDKRA